MKPETIELQKMIEPGCGIAVEQRKFPIAITTGGSRRWLILSPTKEIELMEWHSRSVGLEYLDTGAATEIPAAGLIAEIKSIIAELEK